MCPPCILLPTTAPLLLRLDRAAQHPLVPWHQGMSLMGVLGRLLVLVPEVLVSEALTD